MYKYEELLSIVKNFDIKGDIVNIDPINKGIINTTYVIECNYNGIIYKYLLQKINTNAFKEPYKLMKNIDNVTNYIRDNDDELKEALHIIKTKNNLSLYVREDLFSHKEYYRLYNYIDNTISYDNSTDYNVVYNVGVAFGHFCKVLRNYPIDMLEDTIENFHNTKKRFEKFLETYKLNPVGRNKKAFYQVSEILSRKDECSIITNLLESGKIPYRVTHNDTKLNNVLMDPIKDEPVAVIDLDTVMKGSCLYDYADGIRSISSNAKEDEKDLSKVTLNMDMFKAYTDGYLKEMALYLNEYEVNNMANSIKIITLELAIRFLDDYLSGDTYFKTSYDEHNLDRCKNQLKLVHEIEKNFDLIEDYIMDSYNKYKGISKVKKAK